MNAGSGTRPSRGSTDQRRYLYLAADWLWEAMSPQERQQLAADFVAGAHSGCRRPWT